MQVLFLKYFKGGSVKLKLEMQRPIAFFPQLAKVLGGIDEAIYLQQLYYWSDKGSRPDGYIFKTKADIETETTLSTKVQDRVRNSLEKLEVLETKLIKANGAPTLHYRIDVSRIQELLDYAERADSIMPDGDKPLTEITTKTTTSTNVEGESQDELHQITVDEAVEGEVLDTGVPPPEAYGHPDVNAAISAFQQTFELRLKRVRQQRVAASNLIRRYGLQSTLGAIRAAGEVRDEQYAPQILSLEDLWAKWDKLVAYYRKRQKPQESTVVIVEED